MQYQRPLSNADKIEAPEALSRLRWISLVIFFSGVTAMAIILAVLFATDFLEPLAAVLSFIAYSGFVLLIVYVAYSYARGVWLKAVESEQKLFSISNISTDAVFLLDSTFTIKTWSLGAEKIFGHSAGEAVGQSIALILPDDFVEKDMNELVNLSERGYIQGYRTRRKKKSGELIPVEISASLITPPDNDESGFLVIMRDISVQVEMEHKLEESEERYRKLFESSVDGIVRVDSRGNIVECNRSFAETLGYLPEELKEMTYWEITPSEWVKVDKDVVRNQLENSGYSDEYTKEFKKKDGSRIPVAVRAWRIEDEKRDDTRFWAVVRDISERKKYEEFILDTLVRLEKVNERLREADKVRNEFVAVVSHELRAPLGAIDSSLRGLRSLPPTASEERENLLGVLERGVERLASLVDDMMDLTRIETGQLKLERAPTDLIDLVTGTLSPYENLFEQKDVSFEYIHPVGPCIVEVDPRRIEQVISNLLDNSLKFTERGSVVFKLECRPNRVVCSVTDTGPGVAPQLQKKIFEKFYSSQSQGESNRLGIGLGLAISRGIVEAHGGSIWIESNEGAGSTFSFEIPRNVT